MEAGSLSLVGANERFDQLNTYMTTSTSNPELMSTAYNYQVTVGNTVVGITIKTIVGENDIFWEVCRPHGMLVSIRDSRISKFGYEYMRDSWWITEGSACDMSIEALVEALAVSIAFR